MAISFEKIIIHSVGLIGGSLGLALKASGYKGRIIGLGSPENIDQANNAGCIDEGYTYDKLEQVISGGGILFLCSPVSVIIDTIKTLGTLQLPSNLLITDVGSTKDRIMQTAREHLPSHVAFVGGHPMAGSEKSGAGAADPFLFQNAIYVLVPQKPESSAQVPEFRRFLERNLGCRIAELNSRTHDRIAATISHVPHLLAVALVNMAGDENVERPGTLSFAAGGFRDLTRVASAPYQMWHDILSTNRESIEPVLDQLVQHLHRFKKKLLSEGNLQDEFYAAAATRNELPHNGKGFLTPLSEILVITRDTPGVIAEIASSLAQQNINIKDIEVVKVREGEGGTLMLAFETPADARSAVELLNRLGFTARER